MAPNGSLRRITILDERGRAARSLLLDSLPKFGGQRFFQVSSGAGDGDVVLEVMGLGSMSAPLGGGAERGTLNDSVVVVRVSPTGRVVWESPGLKMRGIP